MQIELFKFTKRINSTKRPSQGSGYTTQCTIKQNAPYTGGRDISDTTVCYPTLFLTGVDDPNSYNYCKTFGDRYYFIRDITVDINGAATLHCEIDVLATRKTEILESSQYVVYSASDYDLQINDFRHPFYKASASQANTVALPWDYDAHLIVTGIGTGRPLPTLYWLDEVNSSNLASWFTDIGNQAILNQFRDYLFSPIDAISSVQLCPIDIMYAAQDVQVVLGHVGITNCSGKLLHYGSRIRELIHVDFGLNLSKLDYTYSSQCSRYLIELPFCGIFELPADPIYYYGKDDGTLGVDVVYDISLATGDIVVYIYLLNSTRKLLMVTGNCYSPIPWGHITGATAPALISLGSAMLSTISAGLGVSSGGSSFDAYGALTESNGTVSGSSYARANVNVGSITNSVVAGVNEARPEISGSSGVAGILGWSQVYFDKIKIRREYTLPDGSLEEMRITSGLPCNKYRQLNGLSGFCQCKNPSIEINDLKVIAELINSYLSSGFFIE